MIAGALQRHVKFPMGYYNLYPNMYIVLVGPPGKCKKSTAMAIGRSTSRQIIDEYNFAVDSTSREMLIKRMSGNFKNEQSVLNVHSKEFASFFATSQEKMLVFLTDIYECPDHWTHETISGSTNKITAPFLNVVAGTTPSSLQTDIPVEAIGVGLTSRIIFVYEDTPRVRPWRPSISPDQEKIGQMLAADLAHIYNLSGDYTIDSSFDKAFQLWEDANTMEPNPTKDSRLDGYFERKPDHIKKLCMILAAAQRDDLVLTEEDFYLSLATLDHVEKRMLDAFNVVGRNPLVGDTNAMLAEILSSPSGVTKSEFVQRFRVNLRFEEIEEILLTLVASGQIILRDGRYLSTAIARAQMKVQVVSTSDG